MYQTLQLTPQVGGIFGVNRKCGTYCGPIVSTICMFLTAVMGATAFMEVGQAESPVYSNQGYWIQSVYQNVERAQVYDGLAVCMLQPILQVSFQVQIYSQSYMEGDPHRSRFFSYLSLFSFFMQILVTAENFQIQFVGWEFIGLVSYLQVNFWYTRQSANFAAQKAFQLNRVGDLGLSIGQLQGIAQIGDQSFGTVFSIASYLNSGLLLMMVFFIVIGAATKSGQVGMSGWLQQAMEGGIIIISVILSQDSILLFGS